MLPVKRKEPMPLLFFLKVGKPSLPFHLPSFLSCTRLKKFLYAFSRSLSASCGAHLDTSYIQGYSVCFRACELQPPSESQDRPPGGSLDFQSYPLPRAILKLPWHKISLNKTPAYAQFRVQNRPSCGTANGVVTEQHEFVAEDGAGAQPADGDGHTMTGIAVAQCLGAVWFGTVD